MDAARMTEIASPRAELKIRPGIRLNGSDEALLLRPYLYADGDGTNAIVNVGARLGTKHSDPLLDIGLDLVVPPWLFWLIDPLLRLTGER